jgi:hypothetical protein
MLQLARLNPDQRESYRPIWGEFTQQDWFVPGVGEEILPELVGSPGF